MRNPISAAMTSNKEKKRNLAFTHFKLGCDLFKEGHFENAWIEYATALKLDPENGDYKRGFAESRYERGNILCLCGYFQLAKIEYSQALNIDAKDTEYKKAWISQAYDLGNKFFKNGLFQAACIKFKFALSLDPENVEYKEALRKANHEVSNALYNRGNYFFNEAFIGTSSNQDYLEKVFFSDKEKYRRVEEANRFYVQARILEPENVEYRKALEKAACALGNILYSHKNFKAACDKFALAQNLDPDNCEYKGLIAKARNAIEEEKRRQRAERERIRAERRAQEGRERQPEVKTQPMYHGQPIPDTGSYDW
jgi:tetratricopeptide (TPR) repeat protein